MKKFFVTILAPAMIAALLVLLVTGCGTKAEDTASPADPAAESAESSEANPEDASPEIEPVTIRLGGLKGPTSMGMVKLLKDAGEGASFNTYEFTIAGSADEVTPKLINGELDIAAVPANLASVLYNNTDGKIKLLAINTLGVLYIVENGESISNLADLKGKTIYATGRGSTPEYVLSYLLEKNGIDPENDITIEWKAEPTEVVSLMAGDKGSIAMMPQPYVTVAQGAIEDLRIAADLTKEWDALGSGSALITGVLVVRSGFADEYPAQVAKFLEEYKASTEYVNANTTEASVLIEEFDIVKAAVAEKALPYCNITFIDGADMKAAMQGYLNVLYDRNPQSVGGSLPSGDFYYGAQ
ncbi:MAG: PhnD/SsuA/transferrin family substrate-binding protein [Clostridiales Family XIII bacterium]|jgi:NitT/TauT family transport system substrate-binding protein|nr:PhnD/SsuA/transferrin family substrate-binding protein [Clostridiales Family XIII bacterium]